MRRGLPMMVWALVWTVVVAVAAVSVWSAISRAGAHVTNPAALKFPSSTTVTPTPEPTPEQTVEATPEPTHEPTTRPTARATVRPSSRATARPTPRDTTPNSPAPVAVQGSWSGQPGRVTATCRGQQIKLDAAVPADGFTLEIESRGPQTLEIEFHQTQGESEFAVRGVCRTEGPRFTAEQE